jgi:trans-aconitate methyltransferase
VNLIERATVLHYHHHRMAVFGERAAESLGWKAEDSQRKRFEVIADAADFTGCSVLDLGCGRGDLKGFLDRRVAAFSYIGIDQMPAFIAQAHARYGDCPRTWFHQCDFSALELPRVDYVVASGALGYRCADPMYHLDMIRKMYEAAHRAAIFNVLDAARFPEHPLLVGRDCEEVIAFCETLCPEVEVVRGYLDDDFTVCVYRDR